MSGGNGKAPFPQKGEAMIAQQIFNGLALGMGYALIAVGYSLVFGILRLVNFSHGSVYAFGAQMAMVFIGLRFGVIPGLIASLVLTGVLGVTIDKLAVRTLKKEKINSYRFLDYDHWNIQHCDQSSHCIFWK